MVVKKVITTAQLALVTLPRMRKIIIAITLCMLLLACGKNGMSERFSQAWEVIEQRPDSVRVLLADLDVPSLSEGEQAEYGLLMTMVDIKTRHEQIKNDSMIAASVKYYDQHGDKWHQAPPPNTSS